MTVRTTSASGAKWRRRLTQKLKALPRGGSYLRVFEGFVLKGSNYKGRPRGVVLDLPTQMLVTDSVYEEQGADPLVTIGASRDLFNPSMAAVADATKPRTTKSMEASGTVAAEFYFATEDPVDAVRLTSFVGSGAYTGSGAYRGGYVFNVDQPTLDLWPFTDAPYLWARCQTRGVQLKSLLRVVLGEDVVAIDSGGYQFYTRALDKDYFPDPVPSVVCDRRTTVGGRDLLVMAVPVTRNLAPYDAETNNTDFGTTGVYFARFEITSQSGQPSAISAIDTWVVSTADFSTGALFVPNWSGDVPEGASAANRWRGVMPNRMVGDVTITEVGGVVWAGLWETSREATDAQDNYVPVKNIVQINIPLGGTPSLVNHYTTVVTNATLDTGLGHLGLDSNPSVMPVVQNFHCFSPPGALPFFVAEAVNFDRESINGRQATTLATGSASLVVGDQNGVRFLTIPDGAFFPPGESLEYGGESTRLAPRIALTDANKQRPKVGLAIRTETSYPTVKWVELDIVPGEFTLRGFVGTAGTEWQVQPTVTCYQRGESQTSALLDEQARPAGLLLSYGVSGEGYTWLSKDSGDTWQQIEQYAARTGAYYFGSGFFGVALDQMYYEVNDDG